MQFFQMKQYKREQIKKEQKQEEEIPIPKILIVEDERPILQYLADQFTQYQCHVFCARNGKEGLKFSLKEHPDVIMLDILMPEMDGMEMLRQLRESNDTYAAIIPVLILTNIVPSSELTKEELSASGVIDYLVKSDANIKRAIGAVKKELGIMAI